MDLLTIDPILHMLSAVAYAAAFACLLFMLVVGKPGIRAVTVAGASGIALHLGGIAARWVVLGHGPVVTKYENLSSYALASAVLALFLLVRRAEIVRVGLVLFPASALLIGAGLFLGTGASNLPPSFTGIWLVLHVSLYFSSFATILTALASSIPLLRPGWAPQARGLREASRADYDATAYRFAGIGFALWGMGMLTGAVWAYHAWGRYWGWDPVETWSLVTWLVLGVYLHLRRFFAWDDRKAAWLLVGSFVLALMSLFGTTLIANSLHAVYFR